MHSHLMSLHRWNRIMDKIDFQGFQKLIKAEKWLCEKADICTFVSELHESKPKHRVWVPANTAIYNL